MGLDGFANETVICIILADFHGGLVFFRQPLPETQDHSIYAASPINWIYTFKWKNSFSSCHAA